MKENLPHFHSRHDLHSLMQPSLPKPSSISVVHVVEGQPDDDGLCNIDQNVNIYTAVAARSDGRVEGPSVRKLFAS